MTKHITVTLTEQQARAVTYAIDDTIELLEPTLDDIDADVLEKRQAYLQRIRNKIHAELVRL